MPASSVWPVSATTDANGQCSFTRVFGRKYYATIFEVTSVEPLLNPGSYYDATLNHDPDGGNGTGIVINSP
jgi:hypothetical protein